MHIVPLLSIKQHILYWDTQLFKLLNGKLTNSFFDAVAPWWRDSITWTPLYIFLIAFILINMGKKGWWWILFALINVAMTDQLSSGFIKNYFQRFRPCNEPSLFGEVRLLLGGCSGGYSFTSSHATNHFGFAMFVFLTLQPYFKKYTSLFFVWAATISYAQVYVGVHYPLDIFAGALLGCLIGWFNAKYYLNKFGLPNNDLLINTTNH